jgi:hypothetical protein
MDDIRHSRPVLLDDLQLSPKRIQVGLAIVPMSLKPTVAHVLVVWPSHVSDKWESLVRPKNQIID